MKNKYDSDPCCQVERGLWTPELCLKAAINTCPTCQRPICKEHTYTYPESEEIECIPCFVNRNHKNSINETNPYTYQDPAWYYFERMRYKTSTQKTDFSINDYHAFNYSARDYVHNDNIEHKDTFFDS